MFKDLPRYNSYRVAGSWIEEVPHAWGWEPARTIFVERKDVNHADQQMLSVTIGRGVLRQVDLLSSTSKKDSSNLDKSKYKLVEPGDLVYNKMRAWQGAAGRSAYRGIVSPAYIVMTPRSPSADYFHHVMRTPLFAKEAERWSYGITSDQWSLRPEHFKMIRFPLPPADEQAAIAKYLAHANARIDKAIAAKRRLVSLLEEQKASVAYERLTRGYEPNDLRVVGLPWADSIPQHWALAPVKRLFSSMVYGTSESSTGEGPVTAVGMGEIKNGNVAVVRRGGLANIPEGLELRQNDLLFNRTNSPDLVGKVGRMTGDCEDLTFASYLVRCRVAEKIDPEWAAYLLNDRAFLGFARSQAYVSLHQANLSSTRYGALPAVIPPYDEQCRIAAGLRSELAGFNDAVDRINREIALLQEFRTSLVADVVTGQVDVRAIAATLPDAPLELFDNAIVELDDDLEDALVGSED